MKLFMGAKLLKLVHVILSLFNFFGSLPFTYRIIQTLLNVFMGSMVALVQLVMNSQSQPTASNKATHGGIGEGYLGLLRSQGLFPGFPQAREKALGTRLGVLESKMNWLQMIIAD